LVACRRYLLLLGLRRLNPLNLLALTSPSNSSLEVIGQL
jgi:hypothetical protein